MKKILISIALLMVTVPVLAQHWHHGHKYHNSFRHYGHHGYYYGGGNSNWVAPLIIGGFVGAAIANNRQQETIVLQQQPVYVPQESCTAWKEIQAPDGRIYRERTCTQ
jgi:hypothetical protein